MKKIVQFIKECVGEMKRVTWPSRSEVFSSIRVVLISTIVMAVVLGLLDYLFTQGLRLIY